MLDPKYNSHSIEDIERIGVPESAPELLSDKSVGSIRRTAVAALIDKGLDDAVRSVDWILQDVLGCSRSQLIGYPDRVLGASEWQSFEEMFVRRLEGEPVQYVVGWTEFYGLKLHVSNAVLIPRPETEVLVDTALRLLRPVDNPAILDVGTGSGCIAIALGVARHCSRIDALDVSRAALDVARVNAADHDVRVDFIECDIRGGDVPFSADYDLIISNPPYVHPTEVATMDRGVAEFEPRAALFTSDDPLQYYRLLLDQFAPLLLPGGVLAVEAHADRATQVASAFDARGLLDVELGHDLSGLPRVVSGRSNGQVRAAVER